ncbi:MAG: SseB family protein [Clostridium sp.]|nr:SseB family protein [Clostridium sp.]
MKGEDMGILDIFKKTSEEKEENVNEALKSTQNEVEGKEEEQIDINIEEIDTLTGERCNELISHVLKDKDFGREFMMGSSIRENIFIIAYMRGTLLPQFDGENMKDMHDNFLKTIEVFEDMLFDKIMKCDRVWKIINKVTGSSVIDNNEEHILISDLYKDNMLEDLKKCGIIAEAVELNHDEFVNELNDLYRTGYKGMRFTDGRQAPCALSRERMLDPSKVEKSEYPVNPETYFSLAAYLQEFRRGVANDGENKSLNMLGRAMIINLMNTKFIIPVQKLAENQFNLPIYKVGNENENKEVSVGLYVFTDEVEMKKLTLTGLKPDASWEVQVNEFKDIIDKVESCHISEVCVNFASTQFRLDRNTINSLKKDAGIVSQEDEVKIKQEKFEAEELPKIFDKDVKVVRTPNGMPVLMREESRVCISNYIINILVRKDMFDDAMNSFLDDNDVNVIKVYDIQTRNADIIKDGSNKTGIFIMPMRYEDENDQEEINDDTIHYSVNAAKIDTNKENQVEIKIADKQMNFYTIVNSGNKKTYLPLFNSADEVQKIFPKNKFRLCKVTYDDVKDKLEPYDGVVIGPTTLSTIIPKEFADKIYDINM